MIGDRKSFGEVASHYQWLFFSDGFDVISSQTHQIAQYRKR